MSPEAKIYMDRIRESYLGGDDSKVASILHELNENQELFLEVFSVFPASMRRQLKEIEAYHRGE